MVWNGDHLFFGSESGELHIWEATTFKEVMRIKGHAGMVLYIIVYYCILHSIILQYITVYHLYIIVYYEKH